MESKKCKYKFNGLYCIFCHRKRATLLLFDDGSEELRCDYCGISLYDSYPFLLSPKEKKSLERENPEKC
ncbi:MAG: hypothetical protein ACTSQY_00605 [Candidatus Odinarchaeia archaeon]